MRASGSQMSGVNRAPWADVQAPLIWITTSLASSCTYGHRGPGLRRRRGRRGWTAPQAVDDEVRVWMAVDQLGALVELSPAQEIERADHRWAAALEDPVEAGLGVGGCGILVAQEDADANRARRLFPVGDDIGHLGIVRIDRLDDRPCGWDRELRGRGAARPSQPHGDRQAGRSGRSQGGRRHRRLEEDAGRGRRPHLPARRESARRRPIPASTAS